LKRPLASRLAYSFLPLALRCVVLRAFFAAVFPTAFLATFLAATFFAAVFLTDFLATFLVPAFFAAVFLVGFLAAFFATFFFAAMMCPSQASALGAPDVTRSSTLRRDPAASQCQNAQSGGPQEAKAGANPGLRINLVERMGIEPTTFALRTRRSPS
jgi:hypothetical protein